MSVGGVSAVSPPLEAPARRTRSIARCRTATAGASATRPRVPGWGGKVEGGWAEVCTEEVEIHHTSDIAPYIEHRLWDDRDIPMLARMADRIHEFGALAGIELAYNCPNRPNFYGREVPLAPSGMPVATPTFDPEQARLMTKRDIRDLRRWHRAVALRARKAGFDLVFVNAAHGLSILQYASRSPGLSLFSSVLTSTPYTNCMGRRCLSHVGREGWR